MKNLGKKKVKGNDRALEKESATGTKNTSISPGIKSGPDNESKITHPIRWEAPEFEYHPKGVSWYWLSLIIAIILIALAAWQNDFLFIIFISIGWFLVVSLAKRFPAVWEFSIDEVGIQLNHQDYKGEPGKFYHWHDLEGFDIREGVDDYGELWLKSKSRLSSFLKINFPQEKEREISDICSKFIPKEEYEESFSDHLSKLIKF